MRRFKEITLAILLIAVLGVTSCGNEEEPEPTQREMVLEALEGTWAVNANSSSFGNTPVDPATVTVTFSETNFSFGGDITTYSTGGSYVIAEDGSISDVTVNIVPADLVLEAGSQRLSINADMTQITVEFAVAEAEGRIAGLGGYSVVFNKQ